MVISADPSSRAIETSPESVVSRTCATRSSWIEPCAPSKAKSPYCPDAWSPALAAFCLDLGAGGQVHGHVDEAGALEELVLHQALDPQYAVRVVDRGLLRGPDVAVLGGVRRPDLDGGGEGAHCLLLQSGWGSW
ncbi:hypothetical protein E1218_22025 [Kribbella turkmenica]|uniref:Uncharacterized protein n=1 Tax=Kribbella turkmenica TaxID=2530375 RepID=A0A4R4WT80_9ACTN|nr:hypothetical protein [Kribbella turkmenica]TDD20778.1 hypothetical protein E1218_22025 [Kribbella turkmenica]